MLICNPPFFDTLQSKQQSQKTNFEGQQYEVCCPGGEVAFIGKIIEESLRTDCVKVFAIFVGKKSSIYELREKFLKSDFILSKWETLRQGSTARWILVWRVTADCRDKSSWIRDKCHGTQTISRCEPRDLRGSN
jgi:23S rRNA (adenine1618-N6)-methyltransferase